MFARCGDLIWNRDDFSTCFRQDYLQTLFPLTAISTSLLYTILRCLYKAQYFRKRPTSAALEKAAREDGAPRYEAVAVSEDAAQDVPVGHASDELVLLLSKVEKSQFRPRKARPRSQLVILVVEAIVILGLIALTLASVPSDGFHISNHPVGPAQLLTWSYIFLLVCVRLVTANCTISLLPNFWYQTAWLYGVQWVFSVLLFRSAIIHPQTGPARALAIAHFFLTSVLAFIALVAPKGNKVVALQYEGKIEPSQEPLANLFSTWTYTWVDPIIWRGYKKTLELADIWNLEARDKAAAVLTDYRQLRRTNALAYHLLKYFKKELTVQALWAGLAGLFTFAPTLLMKAFLEYVEDPIATPTNAAWFYMILLAVSSCVKSVTDGQALWIGRRICIRLRALIVGEIYAKALRRKAATTRDSMLGEKKANAKLQKKRRASFVNQAAKDGVAEVETNDSQANVGTIINLMAVDSFKVSEISAYLHFLWGSTPVQLIVCIILLYRILGLSSLAGIVLMVMVLPINLFIARQFSRYQKKVMAATDIRINTTNEILTNVRIIKYFAWERRFGHIVGEKRQAELRALRNKYILWTAAAGVWFGLPLLITFFSFMLYTVVEKRPLYPSVAFTALSLFGILRYPLDQLADMVAHVQESQVSVDRVEEFLNEDETEKYDQLLDNKAYSQPEEVTIGFDKATLTWGGNDAKGSERQTAFRMINLDVHFEPGRLNIIAGSTGSGKTSLLMALLGEMTLLEGKVHLPCMGSRENLVPDPETGLTESVAYCAQQAWLVNDTIKENILFASPFDKNRYSAVLAACALERDLEILDEGESTLVGEKGITLSGGQKQRISLARALYSSSRHVLLDDCLSAVDSHTAKHIFDHCILGPLMLDRTCILVTHNIALCVPRSQFVVALSNGKITAQGTPDAVVNSGALGEEILKSRPGSKGGSRVHSRIQSTANLDMNINGNSNGRATGRATGRANGHAPEGNSQVKGPATEGVAAKSAKDPANKRTEGRAIGSVHLEVIHMYMRAMGPWFYWVVAFSAFSLQQVGSVGANVWIRSWANAYLERDRMVNSASLHVNSSSNHFTHSVSLSSSMPPTSGPFWNLRLSLDVPSGVTALATSVDINAWYYLVIYAVLSLIFIIISLSREWLIFWGSLRASANIHDRLLHSITRAKLQFFDTTPLGQLMNRFSKDIEAIDQDVSPVAVGVLGCLFALITIVILICVITPKFLIAGFFITLIYVAIGKFYLQSSRDLKRLESIQRSPIYQQFGETLSGVVTIRAYGDERRFMRDNQLRVDTHNRPFIYLWAANRWLALRVDFVGALVAFFAGAFVILRRNTIDAGSAGLSLTYAVMFTENVLWLVRLYSANEQNMNSVERIKEYMDVEQEASAIVEGNRPPGNWPTKGAIQFENYTTRYRRDLDPVLQDLTFHISPGERVGIVGRTGAGKSSLALALFRGIEATDGSICIDGVDIGLIGLQDLREAITIVPQDPTLFTGTLRNNLDPFELFTDEEIFSVLRRVHLINTPGYTTRSSPDSLTPPVTLTLPGSRVPSSSDTATNSEAGLTKRITNSRENANVFQDLSSPIAESGSNLSQGQRQLLCLARALLKAPRVLVMDEATASIDHATDAKIQQTLSEVHDSTIITIAHRLQTIVDYDKILVLDKGRVEEYDAPWDLLEREDSIFRGMCEMSGDLDVLVETAHEAAKKKKLVDV